MFKKTSLAALVAAVASLSTATPVVAKPEPVKNLMVCDSAWVKSYRTGIAGADRDYTFNYKVSVTGNGSCSDIDFFKVDEILIYDMTNHHVHLGGHNRTKTCKNTRMCWKQMEEDNRRGTKLCYSYRVTHEGRVIEHKKNVCRPSDPIN